MKTKLAAFLITCLISICGVNAQNVDVKGTWKLIESSGVNAPSDYHQVKLITPTHFIWMLSDKDGNIVSGAGGTYTMRKDTYTELITMVLPGMKPFYQKKATYKVEIKGKRMTIKGMLDDKINNEEIWEKID